MEGRELVKAVLAPGWTASAMVAKVDRQALVETIERQQAVMPLKAIEPGFDGPISREARDWLKPIGAKTWPEMAPNAKTDWLNGLMMGLSDIPGDVLIAAAKRAIHHPYRFANEIEVRIREIADEILDRRRLALLRLKATLDEIDRAAQPKIEPPAPKVWTPADIVEANRRFRAIGLSMRWRYAGPDDPVAFAVKRGNLTPPRNATHNADAI